MQSYTFGEGLKFVGESGYNLKLTGYAQPMSELKELILKSPTHPGTE